MPPRAPGANLYRSSHSEKKLLARAKVQRRCWGADFTGTAVRAREFLARQAHEAQPHRDADPLLGSAEGGGRRAANFHPRHSQAVAGAREGSGAVPVLSSAHLWTQPQQLSGEHGAAREKTASCSRASPDTADARESSRSPGRAAVRGKTRKTKEAQTAAAERKGLCSSSPAVLREANHGRGFVSLLPCYMDPEHMSGSPGSVILPVIRSLGIPARCPDLLAFQHAGPREPSPATAPCDSRARTVLTQHCWSCQVLGTHLDLPFLHFLRPSAATASSPSLRQGAALQEGGISVPCFQTTAKGKKQMQAHPLLFLQQLKSEPCPGTSPQPLIKEIPPNTYGSPGR